MIFKFIQNCYENYSENSIRCKVYRVNKIHMVNKWSYFFIISSTFFLDIEMSNRFQRFNENFIWKINKLDITIENILKLNFCLGDTGFEETDIPNCYRREKNLIHPCPKIVYHFHKIL